jgi:hypothetical protein
MVAIRKAPHINSNAYHHPPINLFGLRSPEDRKQTIHHGPDVYNRRCHGWHGGHWPGWWVLALDNKFMTLANPRSLQHMPSTSITRVCALLLRYGRFLDAQIH